MIKSKFIDLLETFTPRELKEFEKFVNSSYFNKNKDVCRLFDSISKFYPSFDDESFTKENLFKSLYPKHMYNDARVRNLLSNLFKLGEKFIQQTAFEKNSFSQKLMLVKGYNTRKLSKLFVSTAKGLNQELQKTRMDNEYYMKRHNLENEVVEYFATGDQNIKAHSHLIKSAEYNYFNFLVRYFKMKLSLLTGIEFYKQGFDENNITLRDDLIDEEKIIMEIEKNYSGGNELILVYYYGLQVFKDVENDAGFKKMKKLTFDAMDNVSYKEKFNLYNCLENACARRINAGKTDYIKELFEIQKTRVEDGIFSYTREKTFHPASFRNIVNMAINMKEFQWAENFINKYKSFLHPKDRKNISAHCMAILEFNRENYEKGLEHITKVNLENFIYKIEVRSLFLMFYYELNYIEEALNLINSFKQFLINDKSLSESQKKRSENFLKAVASLVKIKSGADTKINGYIRKEIENENMIGYKPWLMQKTEELAA